MSERTYTPLCHREAVLHGRTAIRVAGLVSVLQGKTHCSAGVFTDDADLHSLAQGYNYTLASISATEFRKLIPAKSIIFQNRYRLLLLLTVVVIYCKCSVHPNKGDYEKIIECSKANQLRWWTQKEGGKNGLCGIQLLLYMYISETIMLCFLMQVAQNGEVAKLMIGCAKRCFVNTFLNSDTSSILHLYGFLLASYNHM